MSQDLRDYPAPYQIGTLKAERDRLQKERDGIELELCQRAENWEAERDRLRAALERIAKADNTAWDMCEIARRALEGK